MQWLTLTAALALAVTSALPATERNEQLENAFQDRAVVEKIIDCFLAPDQCNPQEDAIRARAMATMRNGGKCPERLCTPQQQRDMTRSMELLQENHRDLWTRLIAAMIGIDIK